MGFECPYPGCSKGLSRLQIMHFRHTHEVEPVEFVWDLFGEEISEMYNSGMGCYSIAESLPSYISRNMVGNVVEEYIGRRTQEDSVSGGCNPMKRDEVASLFEGESNPSKRKEVREKISEAVEGKTGVSGEEHPLYGVTGEDHPAHGNDVDFSEEQLQRMSESQQKRFNDPLERWKVGKGRRGKAPPEGSGYVEWYEVEGKERKVQGKLELDIAQVLVDNIGVDGFEVHPYRSHWNYVPDFLVYPSIIIEAKGDIHFGGVEKAKKFRNENGEYRYIVVGQSENTKKIPSDAWYQWEGDRSELLSDLQ